ncbi:MAG: DUF1190 domain-containing protein [Hyphomicrobiaceae bacterium]|nr:DUF1190 domain-containing protein [Hyphomicrobiaceae bacterium]
MITRYVSRALPIIGLLGLATVLGGCNGGASEAEASKAAPKGIFLSTGDCAENGFADFDTCSKGITAAIKDHDSNAPTYDSLRACEASEGPNRCERTLSDTYRRRLFAFLVLGGAKPDGRSLYIEIGKQGYTDNKKAEYLDSDLSLTFSKGAAETLAANVLKKAKKSSFGKKGSG